MSADRNAFDPAAAGRLDATTSHAPPIRTFEQAPPAIPEAVVAAGEIGTFSGHVTALAAFFGCVALGCIVGAPLSLGPVGSCVAFLGCVLLFELRRPGKWPPEVAAATPYLVGVVFGIGVAAIVAASALADLVVAAALTTGIAVVLAALGWSSTSVAWSRGVAPAAFLSSLLWPLTLFDSRPLLNGLVACSAGFLVFAGFAAGRHEPSAPRSSGVWVFVMYVVILALLEG